MENISKAAIDELVKGHDFAKQLRLVMNNNNNNHNNGAGNAEDLVGKVLQSFTNTLFLLDQKNLEPYEDLLSPMQKVKDPSCWNIHPTKSEDSQESCKSTMIKDRRGSYKRRRTSQIRENESETPADDGYAWRKYGQKMILNSKHPRNYYRCTHKFDQGCQATKQVQKVRDNPPLYRTTYYDKHTCRNSLNPEIILDSDSYSDHSAVFLSFDNSLPTKQDLMPSFFSSMRKDECKEEIVHAEHHKEHPQNQSSITFDDYLVSSELPLDPSRGAFCDSVELDDVFETYFQFSNYS